jgi:4-hydroxy-3-polyprenylbenzoate decarboxylase
MQDEYPVFHITCITHRKDPIYAATLVGKPPMEDAWMGKAVERIFLPLMQLTLPEIVDVNLPPEGVFHNLMIVAHPQELCGPGAQGDERHLGDGAGDVHQVRDRGR